MFSASKDLVYKKRQYDYRLQEVASLLVANRISDVDNICALFDSETDFNVVQDMLSLLKLMLEENCNFLYLHDMLAIYQFIRNKKTFDECLDQLEQALQSHASQSESTDVIPVSQDGSFFYIKKAAFQVAKSHGLVSDYFYSWARDNGFKKKAKIIGFLEPAKFKSLLKDKTIFKDATPVLNPLHGMWSHTIQWWSVFSHHKNTSFLQHTPMQLYQQFGCQSSKVWDKVFDNGPSFAYYTSPESLTEALISNDRRWPLLSGTLHNQKFKMTFTPFYKEVYLEKIKYKHADDFANGVVHRNL